MAMEWAFSTLAELDDRLREELQRRKPGVKRAKGQQNAKLLPLTLRFPVRDPGGPLAPRSPILLKTTQNLRRLLSWSLRQSWMVTPWSGVRANSLLRLHVVTTRQTSFALIL